MPRYNVEHNGKWACFSSVVDDYITPWMPLDEYERWRTEQYGKTKGPLETANRMPFADAEETRRFMNADGICAALSDAEVRQPCAEGPCEASCRVTGTPCSDCQPVCGSKTEVPAGEASDV